MHRNKSVSSHSFAMVPKAEIPRSSFDTQYAHKTTFDGGYLVPIYCDEVLPGDTHRVKMTAFARLATPLFPVMDNLHLDVTVLGDTKTTKGVNYDEKKAC
jgi:hypothetical protein